MYNKCVLHVTGIQKRIHETCNKMHWTKFFWDTSEISIAGTDTMVKWVYILFFNLSDYKTFYTQLIYPPPPKAIYSKRAWFYVKIREIQRRELYLVVR